MITTCPNKAREELSKLRAERRFIEIRYDSGKMPPPVAQVVRGMAARERALEIELAWVTRSGNPGNNSNPPDRRGEIPIQQRNHHEE
jgi:hypothetical protein